MDKMRNQKIREKMKVDKNILEAIEEQKLRCLGTLQEWEKTEFRK